MVGSFLDFLGFVLAGVRVEFELSSSIALQQCARRARGKKQDRPDATLVAQTRCSSQNREKRSAV